MNKIVLIIEDHQDMAENIREILQLANYRVLLAPNGKVGVEHAQKQRPDLILCDVAMPELDGYGVLHILNSDPETARIPFVFLTAKSEASDLRKGMNMGADDYITKPFDDVDLLKVIEIRLKKSEACRSTFIGSPHNINTVFNDSREAEEVKRLLQDRPVRTFRKREFVFMEGQTTNDIFFVRKGKVKTYKLNEDGKELITAIYGSGEFLGYASVLEEKPNYESAEALEGSELLIIPKSDFVSMVYSSREMAHKIIKMLTTNLEQTESRLLDLAYQSVRQRVAKVLLGVGNPDADGLISVGRRDLSNLIGTATESLNRTLADFKDEGLVEISNSGVRIIDKAKLEKVAH